MSTIRKTGGPDHINAIGDHVEAATRRTETRALANPGIVNASTAGQLQTGNAIDYSIGGQLYTKAATDDLFDLSGETDTDAGEYQAFWLYLDGSGTATIAAGTIAASEALALAALPDETSTKCPVGVFVAGPSTDFDDAGGLSAQGTIYQGRPSAAGDTAASNTYIAP